MPKQRTYPTANAVGRSKSLNSKQITLLEGNWFLFESYYRASWKAVERYTNRKKTKLQRRKLNLRKQRVALHKEARRKQKIALKKFNSKRAKARRAKLEGRK